MIYFSADDYGICKSASQHISECRALNKVSAFVNFGNVCFDDLKNVNVSLHLNFVEGKPLSCTQDVKLLVDDSGNFKHTFVGLLKVSLLHKNEFQEQIFREIKAQVEAFKEVIGDGLFIDSHQHTHMIPAVFKTLLKVLQEEKINVKYIRIPAEPITPYLKAPTLYFTYSPVNLVKQWLLKFLWQINKKEYKKYNFPTAYFLGVLFSGKMDEKRVKKVLPRYVALADKKGKDVEVLFHPGYVEKDDMTHLPFREFYISENRKTEFYTLQNFYERSELNALH